MSRIEDSMGDAARLTTLLAELLPAPETSLAKARVRAKVMAAARDQLEPQPSPFLRPIGRPIGLAAAAASAVVALGSGGAIGASASALPGEPLYSVKLAVEEVRSAVVAASGDPVSLVVLQEERASQRVAELGALAARGRPIPPAVAEAAAAHTTAAAHAAAGVPEGKRAELNQKRDAAQSQREETLTRVLTQVQAPPARTAIAGALERHEDRQLPRAEQRQEREDDRQQRQDTREERDEARRDDRDARDANRGPGSGNSGNSGNSGRSGPDTNSSSGGSSGSGNSSADGRARLGASAPIPTPTPQPTPQPRPRAAEPPGLANRSSSGPNRPEVRDDRGNGRGPSRSGGSGTSGESDSSGRRT